MLLIANIDGKPGVVGTAEVLMAEYQKLAEGKQTVPWARPRKSAFIQKSCFVLAEIY